MSVFFKQRLFFVQLNPLFVCVSWLKLKENKNFFLFFFGFADFLEAPW